MATRKVLGHFGGGRGYRIYIPGTGPSVLCVLEMMRYDRCTPYTSDDVVKLAGLLMGEPREADHTVKFCFFFKPPTVERWRSFGCTVLDVG